MIIHNIHHNVHKKSAAHCAQVVLVDLASAPNLVRKIAGKLDHGRSLKFGAASRCWGDTLWCPLEAKNHNGFKVNYLAGNFPGDFPWDSLLVTWDSPRLI